MKVTFQVGNSYNTVQKKQKNIQSYIFVKKEASSKPISFGSERLVWFFSLATVIRFLSTFLPSN